MTAIKTEQPPKAKVGFNMQAVALHLVTDEKEQMLARNCVLEMPRDPRLGEADPRVRYVRRLAFAFNSELAVDA